MSAAPPAPWWLDAAPVDAQGLSTSQACEAFDRFGPNSFESARKRPLALQFLARFRNPLVLVLLAASAISAATGDVANFAIIMRMVLLSVALDFIHARRGPDARTAADGGVGHAFARSDPHGAAARDRQAPGATCRRTIRTPTSATRTS